MFRILFTLKHKVERVRQVKFEPSSYTSVDVHKSPLPSDIADHPPTIIQELHAERLAPTTQTTTRSTQQTFPGSYAEMPVYSSHPPFIELPSPPAKILLKWVTWGRQSRKEQRVCEWRGACGQAVEDEEAGAIAQDERSEDCLINYLRRGLKASLIYIREAFY